MPFHTCPPNPAILSGPAFVELGAAAERAGFTGVALTEHPAPGERWRQAGGHDALDPFVGLAYLAAATSTLRLVTYLCVLPYRNPFLVAKSVASLDVLSGGRVELGLGTGYQRAEFRALGVDFEARNRLFDEALTVLRQAWQGEPVVFESETFAARGNTSQPTPTQKPHPPVWLGGNSRITRDRVVAHAQGWMPMPNPRATAQHLRSPPLETLDDLAELLGDLKQRALDAGRSEPIAVMWCLPDVALDEVGSHVDLLAPLGTLGVDWVAVNGQGSSLDDMAAWIERYGKAVIASHPLV